MFRAAWQSGKRILACGIRLRSLALAGPARLGGQRSQTKQISILLVESVIPCPAILSKGDVHEKIDSRGSGGCMRIYHFHGHQRPGCSQNAYDDGMLEGWNGPRL